MINMSTCWNLALTQSAAKSVEEIRSIGYAGYEMGWAVRRSLFDEFNALVKKGELQIDSLHDVCPSIPSEETGGLTPSPESEDVEERKLFVEQSKHTIDAADEIGARVVVSHGYYVTIDDPCAAAAMRCRVYEHLHEIPDPELQRKARRLREENKQPLLDRLLKNLDILNKHAQRRDVCFAIETPCYFEGIPNPTELRLVLDEFRGGNIGYWHDTGHAQTQQESADVKQEDWLKAAGHDLKGMHLHDFVEGYDHKSPGTGIVDFDLVAKYLRPDVVRVNEAHQRDIPFGPPVMNTFEDQRKAREFLESKGF